MSSHVTKRQQTNGFLPIEPFRHMNPTAIGELALDESPLELITPGGPGAEGARDTMVMVRLHGSPLGFVYLERPSSSLTPEILADAVWNGLATELSDHVKANACVSLLLAGPDSLLGGLPEPSGRCAAAVPTRPEASVAVIIPTAGRSDRLARCLRSLQAVGRRELEVIVVDNSPHVPGTEAVVREAREFLGSIRYVPEGRPGSSVARNRGVAESQADILAFTDDDVIVDRGWLDWLIAPLIDGKVGCVTGMVLPVELETPAQKQFELYAGFSKGVSRRRWDLRSRESTDRFLYPYWGGVFGSGNSMAFRREVLLTSGGFDPALGAGSLALAGADIEAMSAVVLRGLSLVYEPRSLCWHEHRRNDDALSRQVFNYGVGLSAILTKFMLHDRRFPGAVARTVPLMLQRRRARQVGSDADLPGLPPNLAALQRRGLIRGPARYARSVRWARRLGLDAVLGR